MAIRIPIVTEFDQRGLKLAERRFGQFQKQTQQIGNSIKSAFLPAAAAVAGLGAAAFGAAKAAIDDQKSQALLAAQLQATTKATEAQIKANEDFVSGLALSSGIADDELRPSLSKVARSTRDLTKAQKLLRISVDVSRGSGKSLSQVTDALARAYGGNVKALARLDPSLKQFITKTTTADEAVEMLAKNFKGNANKYAETFAGRIDRLKVAVGEATESFGYALLPALERIVGFITNRVLPYVDKLVKALEEQGLSGAIKTAGRDIGNFIIEADGWTGTVIEFTAAIVALGIAIKGLILFNAVTSAASAMSGVLSALGTAVIPGLAVSAGFVAGIFASLLATVVAFVGLMRDVPARSAFFEYLANTAKLIANGFILAYNAATRLLNLPIKGINLLPGVNAAEIPLMDLYDFTFDTSPATQRSAALNKMPDAAQIQINVQGAIDPVSTGRQLVDILNQLNRRGISPGLVAR